MKHPVAPTRAQAHRLSGLSGPVERPRERADSGIRLSPHRTGFVRLLNARPGQDGRVPAPDAATTLADEQRTLTAGVLRVQNLLRETPRDPSARAAAQAIRDRAADLNALANALGALSFHVRDARLAQLFENDAPLMEYLRGLYAWTKAVVRALEEAATGLRVLSPDWSAVRARIEDASSFYLADRERSIAEAATRLRVRQPDLDATIDEHLWQIFWAASYLFRSLEQKFG